MAVVANNDILSHRLINKTCSIKLKINSISFDNALIKTNESAALKLNKIILSLVLIFKKVVVSTSKISIICVDIEVYKSERYIKFLVSKRIKISKWDF